ncbi:radical SAM protein [candidate division KSB1 bacterium]
MLFYKPKGAAAEYAKWALNMYNGCAHNCRYCYGRMYATMEEFFSGSQPKSEYINNLIKEAPRMKSEIGDEEVLLTFQGDCYQPAEQRLKLTRQSIEILNKYDYRYTILTKGGMRAVRDFDLLKENPKARFGSTIVFTEQQDADYYEPNAPVLKDRWKAVETAHSMGIPTWISLEPVIYPSQVLELIRRYHPIVSHWKIGKLNHDKKYEDTIDWVGFRNNLINLMDSLGYSDDYYYLKDSLKNYVDEDSEE